MIAQYKCKNKEDRVKNVNLWNEHFDKLKETHPGEQDSIEIDNLLKYVENTTTIENRQIHRNYQGNAYCNYHRRGNRNPRGF